MEISDLNKFGIHLGKSEKSSTYGVHAGFLEYHVSGHKYVVPDCKAIRGFLDRIGYKYDEDAFIHDINEQDVYSFLEKEGPMGIDFLKSYAFVCKKDTYRDHLRTIKTEYELRDYLKRLSENDPYFKLFNRDERRIKQTEAYKVGVEHLSHKSKSQEDDGYDDR